jgi:hypothetical protein
MSEGASIFEMTLPSELPIPAHFSLQLRLVWSHKLISVFLTCEVLLGSLHCGHLLVVVDLYCFLRFFLGGILGLILLWRFILINFVRVFLSLLFLSRWCKVLSNSRNLLIVIVRW